MTVNEQDLIYLNGINGATGKYSIPPLTKDKFVSLVTGLPNSPEHQKDLERRKLMKDDSSFGVQSKFGDGSDIRKTRWGIIFPAQAEPAHVDAILTALEPLISLREKQMKKPAEIYRDGRGVRWVTPSDGSPPQPETKSDWLARHGAGPGQVNADIVPFYLMIVADPNSIPYIFQYELDVQYAVGRIYFHTIDEYARYARSVVQAESGKVKLARKASFFSVANPGDRATNLSNESLVTPLVRFMKETSESEELGWQVKLVDSKDAVRDNLKSMLGGNQTPAFLFTASHGIDFPYMHPDQYRYQGAIVCRDWNGPNAEDVTRKHYLTAEDIPDDHNLTGSIVFHFACFGAGTPYWDEHAAPRNKNRKALAGRPFVAALPNKLLSLPGGGALAVIGHIDRAWNYSFQWTGIKEQTSAYEGILYELMHGKQVGLALESMNDRYSDIATNLTTTYEDLKFPPFSDALLSRASFLFASHNDARGYAIVGDPAVCIPLAPENEPEEARPSIKLKTPVKGVLPVILNPDSLVRLNANELDAVDLENQALGLPPAPDTTPAGETPAAPQTPPGELPRAPIQNIQVTQPGGGQTDGGGQTGSTQAQPTGQPFSTALDGLAFALQIYTGEEKVSFSLGVEGVPYNLLDNAKEQIKKVVESLNNALSNLSKKMEDVTKDLTALEVITNVVDDLDTFDPNNADTQNADRRILTRISADGDIQIYLPRGGGKLEEDVLTLHNDMVRQALSNRLEVARALAEMIAGLFGGQK